VFKQGHDGGVKYASTVALSILVTIEMLNSLNSLSENESLLVVPPWSNIYLLLAIGLSFSLHVSILYIPGLAQIFSVVPLTLDEWLAVFWFSFPVILIDEILKFFSRRLARMGLLDMKRKRKRSGSYNKYINDSEFGLKQV